MKRSINVHKKIHETLQKKRGLLLVNNQLDLNYTEAVNLSLAVFLFNNKDLNQTDFIHIIMDIIISNESVKEYIETEGQKFNIDMSESAIEAILEEVKKDPTVMKTIEENFIKILKINADLV
jgi:hypothetical protein